MIEDGITPEQVGFNEFEIPSQTNNKKYIVSMHAGTWSCTCPDHQFRHVSCKHIHAVTLWQRLSTKLQQDHEKKIIEQPEHILVDEITCKFCGSTHIIKYGKAKDKLVYRCKDCARKFVPNKGFEKMWYDPRTVSATLDLYFKGVSLRKIADHLRQCHGLDVGHASVYRWICKYTEIIQAYIVPILFELALFFRGTKGSRYFEA